MFKESGLVLTNQNRLFQTRAFTYLWNVYLDMLSFLDILIGCSIFQPIRALKTSVV